MDVIAAPEVSVQLAIGPFTDMSVKGGCDGGMLVWDAERRDWRDWVAQGITEDDPRWGDGRPHGVVYEAGLDAAILAWLIMPRDIVETEWTAPRGGVWSLILPPGAPEATRWHQMDGSPGLEWSRSIIGHPTGMPICVSLYREATPRRDEVDDGSGSAENLPWYYTAVEFGGQYRLVLPKWRPAELWKRTGGVWECVLRKQWSHAEVYDDSHTGKELFVVILNLDGALLIKNSETDESIVYREERGIVLPTADITISGNAGCAYVGYHRIEFSDDLDNHLYGRESRRARLAGTWPERRVIGTAEAGCGASLALVDAAGAVLANTAGTESEPITVDYWRRLTLSTNNVSRTPVVRWAGVVYPSVPVVREAQWQEFGQRLGTLEGGWEIDLNRRIARQRYTVTLDNADGALRDWTGMRRAAIRIRRRGGEWCNRATGLAYVTGDDVVSVGEATVTVETLDRVDVLYEIQCGERAPLDGMKIADAIREVLSWGGVAASEIAAVHDSGRRIPTSRYAAQMLLQEGGGSVRWDGGNESSAVAQPDPDMTVGDFYTLIAHFDMLTALVFDAGQWWYKSLLDVGDIHHVYETETPDALDAMRGGFRAESRVRDRYTTVRVVGRNRVTQQTIVAEATDGATLNGRGDETGFVGYDRTHTIRDDKLNTCPQVVARCRWEYQRMRAGQRSIGFEDIAPERISVCDGIVPHESRTQGGNGQYLVTAFRERVSEEWTGQVDAMDARAFLISGF